MNPRIMNSEVYMLLVPYISRTPVSILPKVRAITPSFHDLDSLPQPLRERIREGRIPRARGNTNMNIMALE